MQIGVSVVVVLVALAVVTDATEVTETEPSLTQRFEKFQHDFQEFVDRVEVKAKEVFHDAHYSELSNQTRSWFAEGFQKMKEKLKALFPNEGTE